MVGWEEGVNGLGIKDEQGELKASLSPYFLSHSSHFSESPF
jgi:hypothetical protein